MAQILLVRHGETKWNVKEVFRGQIDIELNETGMKQAELLAEYLSNIKIDAIYSSALKRALTTAEKIASFHNIKVVTTPGLMDLNFGEWQGLSRQEVKGRYKELYAQWLSRPERVRMPAGENLDEVRTRAMGMVDQEITKYDSSIILVSHRVVNKVLICALLGLDNSHFWNIEQSTCGLTIFTHKNGRFVLTRHNDTSYLRPLSGTVLSDF